MENYKLLITYYMTYWRLIIKILSTSNMQIQATFMRKYQQLYEREAQTKD